MQLDITMMDFNINAWSNYIRHLLYIFNLKSIFCNVKLRQEFNFGTIISFFGNRLFNSKIQVHGNQVKDQT